MLKRVMPDLMGLKNIMVLNAYRNHSAQNRPRYHHLMCCQAPVQRHHKIARTANF
jgi:hypothetical protein